MKKRQKRAASVGSFNIPALNKQHGFRLHRALQAVSSVWTGKVIKNYDFQFWEA